MSSSVLPVAPRSDAVAAAAAMAVERAPEPRIAVVIPCYRTAAHIAGVIRSIPARYAPIVVVDDCSPDDTAAVVERLDDERVVLVRHERNRGVGGAMLTGYAEALRLGADICVKMDGDGQMSAEDLDALVAPLVRGEADYAKGNRFVDLRALHAMPRARLAGNVALSFLSKMASGYWNMLDVSNGFTAVSARMLRRISARRISERYFFESSMLIELNILRARVADVEMPARYGDEKSSLRISRVLMEFPPLLVLGLARRFYWRYLVQEFGVVSMSVLLGLPLLLFGVTFGAARWIHSAVTGTYASAGTVVLAALPIILGVQLLLVALVLDVLSSTTRKVHRFFEDS